ncbi:MAG: GNAT family N-acetyltransferase [Anaerolineales bacterium]|nr:GNAT family N-acetyltransferase [Anaerolineales bacterium]
MPATDLQLVVPTNADGASILGIARNIELFEPGDIDTIQELWAEFTAKGDAASWYHFVAARRDGQVLGFACYGQRPLTQGTYDLYWIAVDKNHHRQGIGEVLLDEAEKQVKARGGRLLIAETAGKLAFEPTRRFYLRSGYQLEARIRDFYSPGDDLVVFTKRL